MILTVTLNAAVDKTYRIEGFQVDRVHRPSEWRVEAGGKGVNVARVYHTLGGAPLATGLLGGYNGRFVAEALRREGIEARFVATREESRVCIAVVDPASATQTEINEPGPLVRPVELRRFLALFDRLLAERSPRYVALSGSVPPGVPTDVYADLARRVARSGARCVLDASGDPLKAGATARPWMVKPNRFELSALTGRPLSGVREFARAACELVESGVGVAAVTLGAEGCVLAAEDGVWLATPPEVPFVSAVGSGDSFVGAFVYALEQGCSMPEALRMGVGAGTANATVYGSGFCSADSILEVASRVRVRRL